MKGEAAAEGSRNLGEGRTETFMHKNADWQHRRDSTYTVPYVLANPICATRDHDYVLRQGGMLRIFL